MARYEYKVVPAPSKTRRIKGMKTVEDRFAFGMEMLMNDLGAEGWEYLRAGTLPCEERSGIRGRTTESIKHMLIFRRSLDDAAEQPRALLRDYSSEPPPAQMSTAAPPPMRPAPEIQPPERAPERGYDNGYSNGYDERGAYDDRGSSFSERPPFEPEYRERGGYGERSNGQYADAGPAYDNDDDGYEYEPSEFQRPARGSSRRRPPSDAPWKMSQDWEDDR